jgi:hypothetical protein
MEIRKDKANHAGEQEHRAGRHSARKGWEEAFRAVGSSAGDQPLLDDAGANEFDRKEWCW